MDSITQLALFNGQIDILMENIIIPNEVYQIIKDDIKVGKINMNESTVKWSIKKCLRTNNMQKYCENTEQILRFIRNQKPFFLLENERNVLCEYFLAVSSAFTQEKTDNEDFLPYRYILYKLCELNKYSDRLSSINLKMIHRLLHYDAIWKNICKRNKWEYIPTLVQN